MALLQKMADSFGEVKPCECNALCAYIFTILRYYVILIASEYKAPCSHSFAHKCIDTFCIAAASI
jgi:hypothetical protein